MADRFRPTSGISNQFKKQRRSPNSVFSRGKSTSRKTSPKTVSKRSSGSSLSPYSNTSKDPNKLFVDPKRQTNFNFCARKKKPQRNLGSPQYTHRRNRSDGPQRIESPYIQGRAFELPQQKTKKYYGRQASAEQTLRKEPNPEDCQITKVSSIRSLGSSFQSNKKDRFETEKENLTRFILKSFRTKGLPPVTTLDFYKITKQIGKGAFGKVYLGIHKLSGIEVAIKTIDKSSICDERTRRKVFQEVFVMKRINHKNVIKLLEVFESPQHLMIVLEYAGGGDLLQHVRSRIKLSEAEAKLIFHQVVLGVKACHDKLVIHRDLKLDNVLINTNLTEAKLCDFGVARTAKNGERVKEQCGTPAYLAPEIIADTDYEPFLVDLWSLGVVLYTMLCGTVPFKASSLADLHKLILKCDYVLPDWLSYEARDLIVRMLNPIPQHRIKLEAILDHRWFYIFDEESIEDSIRPRFTGNNSSRTVRTNSKLILKTLKQMGFPEEYVAQSLKFKDINHATATYHLLEMNFNVN